MTLKLIFSVPDGITNDEKQLLLLNRFYQQGQKLVDPKLSKNQLSTQLKCEVQEALHLNNALLFVKTNTEESVFEIL